MLLLNIKGIAYNYYLCTLYFIKEDTIQVKSIHNLNCFSSNRIPFYSITLI